MICLVLMGVLIAAVEIGFWTKGSKKGSPDSIERTDIALILDVWWPFETRRQLVIEEANATGTTYLRAKALVEPRSSEIQELLRQYTAFRVEIAGLTDDAPEKIRELDNRTKQLLSLIWSHAAALARESPNPITSIFLQTLNPLLGIQNG